MKFRRLRQFLQQRLFDNSGTARSVNHRLGLFLNDPDTYAAFRTRPPDAVLAGSLCVFDVTNDPAAREKSAPVAFMKVAVSGLPPRRVSWSAVWVCRYGLPVRAAGSACLAALSMVCARVSPNGLPGAPAVLGRLPRSAGAVAWVGAWV